MRYFYAIGLFMLFQVSLSSAQVIGTWSFSAKGLPVYQYKGALPFKAVDKNGNDALQPEDPYFLTGNYRMTLITHASGIYQFFTAERAWGRLNASNAQTNYGWNDASIIFKDDRANKKVLLTGLTSVATNNALVNKSFGVGFARYQYHLNNKLTCTRIISVKPSENINSGNPSFVITVALTNKDIKSKKLTYTERMLVNFVLNSTQYTQAEQRPFAYKAHITVDAANETALADLAGRANRFSVFTGKSERSRYDVDPPSIFMYAKSEGSRYSSVVKANKDTLATEVNLTLKPGESKSFHIVMGLADEQSFAGIKKQVDELFLNADMAYPLDGLYAQQWKNKLPDLSAEKNEVLRREMLWNAHAVEASAKYSRYYKETFIPQGTVYSYYYGDNISNRDHLQAALAACYINPALAKSSIRYVMKHTDFDGEIKRGNTGFGYTEASLLKESDEQLYLFNTIAEYLLITKDYAFLSEQVEYYPAEYGKKDTVLNILKRHFIYLRDEIGTGENGLVKMLNSDWSDSFFHKYSPNVYGGTAESHLNTTMVLAIFPKLINVLKQANNPGTAKFVESLEAYRAAIDTAFTRDFGNRKFAARAYLNNSIKFGLDNVCIEPQGYLLQMPDLSVERKKEIYRYIKSKIITPEKIGIRTRERPLWGGNPDGEDGGIWYSLEYPLLLGVATFDKEEAQALLMKFSFQNFATNYPNYWVGQWTAPDEMNSTLYREGLYAFWVPAPDKKTAFQGYCSHSHTWPLFCYFKLK